MSQWLAKHGSKLWRNDLVNHCPFLKSRKRIGLTDISERVLLRNELDERSSIIQDISELPHFQNISHNCVCINACVNFNVKISAGTNVDVGVAIRAIINVSVNAMASSSVDVVLSASISVLMHQRVNMSLPVC